VDDLARCVLCACSHQVEGVKAEYAAKLEAAEARVKTIEAARDEAKKQAAALAAELESSKKTAEKVSHC